MEFYTFMHLFFFGISLYSGIELITEYGIAHELGEFVDFMLELILED